MVRKCAKMGLVEMLKFVNASLMLFYIGLYVAGVNGVVCLCEVS